MSHLRVSKVMASLLSSALLMGTIVGAPLTGEAKAKKDRDAAKHVDWGVINEDRIIQALIEQGVLDEDASPKQTQKAVEEYVTRGTNPGHDTDGIDTSSRFGKKAYKARKALQENVAALISGDRKAQKMNTMSAKSTFTDNAVLALIEFPDLGHNEIEKPENDQYLWTEDFNEEHYEKLLFGNTEYKTPEGKKLLTLNQFYKQQSAGSWAVDGTVTPWIEAKHDAAYYGAHAGGANDARPDKLVEETLETIGDEIAGDEEKYDQRDPYDLDMDGDIIEPDGMLDNLFVVHSGVGEDSGGGPLGDDAIWAHRSTLEEPKRIPGTTLKAYDYIIQGEEGAAGVFAHEYGHNLGLPDEYDTLYSGGGSPVEVWSIMSGGSWAGKIPGTEPTGFSPYAKLFFHETYGGSWPVPEEIDLEDLKDGRKYQYPLKEAVANTSRNKLLKINLPEVEVDPPTQPIEEHSYFSTKGNSLDTRLISEPIDLTTATSASLAFESWREIETDYDYLYVNVYANGSSEPVRVETFTDTTDGTWEHSDIDLSQFAGQTITVEFQYKTDVGLAMNGFYVDNIEVRADGQIVFFDNAEEEPKFELKGFELFDGSPIQYPQFYLIEWRTHNGVDEALAHYRRNNSLISFDPGMLVWFYDGQWGEDNWTGLHPGHGFLGVVDAHQRGHYWNIGAVASTRYQLVDAAFNLKKNKTSDLEVIYPDFSMFYEGLDGIDTFSDKEDYSAREYLPDSGKILPKYGLTIEVEKVSSRGNEALISVSRD